MGRKTINKQDLFSVLDAVETLVQYTKPSSDCETSYNDGVVNTIKEIHRLLGDKHE